MHSDSSTLKLDYTMSLLTKAWFDEGQVQPPILEENLESSANNSITCDPSKPVHSLAIGTRPTPTMTKSRSIGKKKMSEGTLDERKQWTGLMFMPSRKFSQNFEQFS